MNNKKIRIVLITAILLIIGTGTLLLILPLLSSKIEGTSFTGIMIILSGIILMLGSSRLESRLLKIFTKIISAIKNESKTYIYFFLMIMAAAIGFRLVNLTKLINYNEASIYLNYLDNKTFHQLFFYNTPDNFILNNIFIKFFYLISNKELWVLRMPSFIAGIILIPAVYVFVRTFYNKYAAIIASAIIAASPFFIYYSTDMSGISLIMLLFLILFLTAKYLMHNNDSVAWIFFVIVSSSGFLVSPLFLLPFLTIIIWIIFSVIFRDTSYKVLNISKRLVLSITCTFMFTFLLYIPVTISSGLKNVFTYNFLKTDRSIGAFNSFFMSIKSSWIDGNQNLNMIYLVLLGVAVIFSLAVSKKNAKQKVPIFYALAAAAIIFLLSGLTFPFAEAWAFAVPVLIMAASYSISYVLGLGKSVINKKKNNVFPMSPIFVSFLILIIIFFLAVTFNSVQLINKSNTLKDSEKIVNDFGAVFVPQNQIFLQKPTDYLIKYQLSKKGIIYNNDKSQFYPEGNILIIVNKSPGQTIDEVINSYYPASDLTAIGYKKPEVIKEYETATVFESANMISNDNIIFNLNEQSKTLIELKNFSFSNTAGEVEIEMNDLPAGSLEYIKIHVELEEKTDYLIIFEIKEKKKLENKIFVDFFGNGYDNLEQEFNINQEDIEKDSFTEIRRVINSGKLNNEDTFLRIFSYSPGQIVIKNLKLYKIIN